MPKSQYSTFIERTVPITLVADCQKHLLQRDDDIVAKKLTDDNNEFRDENDILRSSLLRNLSNFGRNAEMIRHGRELSSPGANLNESATVDDEMNEKFVSPQQADFILRDLPAHQKSSTCESNGSIAHTEADLAYKEILAQSSQSDPNLCAQILQGIIKHLDSHDAATRSAWLETLLDLITHLPLNLIHSMMLPLITTKSQNLNDCGSRLIAAKLLGRVAYKLDHAEVKSDIVPLVQALCQDFDANIRASVCQQLAIIAYSLSLADLKTVILPLIIDFSKDEDECVREATLEIIVSLSALFDDDSCVQVLVPLCKSFIAENLNQRNRKTLIALSRHFAALYKSVKRALDDNENNWFLSQFCKLCAVGTDDNECSTNTTDENQKEYSFLKTDQQTVLQTCRENAASSFWLLSENAGVDKFSTILLPAYKKLCQDPETEIRCSMASEFHNMVKFVRMKCHLLFDSFMDLIYSGESEVISALTMNLGSILEDLYMMDQNNRDENGNLTESVSTDPKSLHFQLTRILLACNRLIRNSSNWRCHEQYLHALSRIHRCVSKRVLTDSFLTMIKDEILNTRALPCRVAALSSLITWVENQTDVELLDDVMSFFNKSVIKHKSCHRRALYIDACQIALKRLPADVFKKHLLNGALSLANDPVANIRIRLCKLLPIIRSRLDCNLSSNLVEQAMRVISDKTTTSNGYIKEVINAVTHDLSTGNKKPCLNGNLNCPSVSSTSLQRQMETAESSKERAKCNQETPKADDDIVENYDKKFEIPVRILSRKNEEKRTSADHAVTSDHPTITNSNYLTSDKIEKQVDDYNPVDRSKKLEMEKPNQCQNDAQVETKEENHKSLFNSVDKSILADVTPGSPLPLKQKKTAIIKPHQITSRSPSPLPIAGSHHSMKTENFDKAKFPNSYDSLNESSPRVHEKIRSSRSDSLATQPVHHFSSSTLPRRSSYLTKSNGERRVPITMLHSSPLTAPHTTLSNSPSATRRLFSSTTKPPIPYSSSISSQYNVADSLKNDDLKKFVPQESESATSRYQRNIPVVRTGSVLKSVAQFEGGNGPTSTNISSNSLPRASAYRPGLGYSKHMNRSFASLSPYSPTPSLAIDRENRKDYDSLMPQSLRKNSFSALMSQSVDRPFSLTRVRSGSSIQASSLPHFSARIQK